MTFRNEDYAAGGVPTLGTTPRDGWRKFAVLGPQPHLRQSNATLSHQAREETRGFTGAIRTAGSPLSPAPGDPHEANHEHDPYMARAASLLLRRCADLRPAQRPTRR